MQRDSASAASVDIVRPLCRRVRLLGCFAAPQGGATKKLQQQQHRRTEAPGKMCPQRTLMMHHFYLRPKSLHRLLCTTAKCLKRFTIPRFPSWPRASPSWLPSWRCHHAQPSPAAWSSSALRMGSVGTASERCGAARERMSDAGRMGSGAGAGWAVARTLARSRGLLLLVVV